MIIRNWCFINIVVTCDANYLPPLRTMLFSLISNNDEKFNIFLIHSSIDESEVQRTKKYVDYISSGESKLTDIKIKDSFENSTISFYYTKEMYYRLIAYRLLPDDINRALYLDPDLLVLKSVKDLYEIDFENKHFAASIHAFPGVQELNKLRLGASNASSELLIKKEDLIENYFNSGILMMNFERLREDDRLDDIMKYADEASLLGSLMPDQDLLNYVFKDSIKEIDEIKYNFDARRFLSYHAIYDIDAEYVAKNTVIMHFCGSRKPWNNNYFGKFDVLYKKYQLEAEQLYLEGVSYYETY